MWYVNCRRSGGMMGYAESLLKKNGEVVEFETREEAQAEADALNVRMNSNPHSLASYRYTPTECGW